jgi:lipopolysaccharide biosynthesis glycosyltransferase
MTVESNKPALHDNAVMFCCTPDYVWLACFAATQLQAAEQSAYDICICTFEEISVPARAFFPFIRWCHVESHYFRDCYTDDSIKSPIAYLRIALPTLFRNDYNKLLYIDSDVFFPDGGIAGIFASANCNSAVSAVCDTCNLNTSTGSHIDKLWERVDLNRLPYLNSGVLLFDVAAYCEEALCSRIMLFARRNPYLPFYDQTAINCVLKGRWSQLSFRWNWQMVSQTMFDLEPYFRPKIVHFAGQAKPFKVLLPSSRKYAEQYQAFLNRFPLFVNPVTFSELFIPANKYEKSCRSTKVLAQIWRREKVRYKLLLHEAALAKRTSRVI